MDSSYLEFGPHHASQSHDHVSSPWVQLLHEVQQLEDVHEMSILLHGVQEIDHREAQESSLPSEKQVDSTPLHALDQQSALLVEVHHVELDPVQPDTGA